MKIIMKGHVIGGGGVRGEDEGGEGGRGQPYLHYIDQILKNIRVIHFLKYIFIMVYCYFPYISIILW